MSYHRSIDGDNDFSNNVFFISYNYNSDPVSVCVLLYWIILIQILIKYNVKNLITACTRLHDSDPQNWKISLPCEGGHPRPTPSPPLGRFAPLAFVLKILYVFFLKSEIIPPPHTFEDLSTPLLTCNLVAINGYCLNRYPQYLNWTT